MFVPSPTQITGWTWFLHGTLERNKSERERVLAALILILVIYVLFLQMGTLARAAKAEDWARKELLKMHRDSRRVCRIIVSLVPGKALLFRRWERMIEAITIKVPAKTSRGRIFLTYVANGSPEV